MARRHRTASAGCAGRRRDTCRRHRRHRWIVRDSASGQPRTRQREQHRIPHGAVPSLLLVRLTPLCLNRSAPSGSNLVDRSVHYPLGPDPLFNRERQCTKCLVFFWEFHHSGVPQTPAKRGVVAPTHRSGSGSYDDNGAFDDRGLLDDDGARLLNNNRARTGHFGDTSGQAQNRHRKQ